MLVHRYKDKINIYKRQMCNIFLADAKVWSPLGWLVNDSPGVKLMGHFSKSHSSKRQL